MKEAEQLCTITEIIKRSAYSDTAAVTSCSCSRRGVSSEVVIATNWIKFSLSLVTAMAPTTSVMISASSGSHKILVFWRQISSPNSKGFPRTGASNKGRSEKFSDFLALSVNISKKVADTVKVTIND